ncbi:Phosphoglycerate mutase family protein [Euphorbia peplus]|nr:Phosphoglycerate mutase family protein [Euphorbia peplus]
MEVKSFLRNKYWVLRHGKSIPNEKGLIVCSLENGIRSEYQLAPEGINQARSAGQIFLKELKEKNIPIENVRICYSPFARTTHTAKVVASVLDIPFDGPQFKVMEDIRERYFGPSFELMSQNKYQEIYELDAKDPCQRPEDAGESAQDVADRLAKSMAIMESQFQGCAILIVSHGDPLQILQTMLHAAKPQKGSDLASTLIQAVNVPSILSQHFKYALLTGEIRALII